MSIDHYIKKIGVFPVLSPEEEEKLFKELRKLEADLISIENKTQRVETATRITQVRNKIIQSNLRLVISIAQKINISDRLADIIELIDEGSLGLMEAIDKFDPKRGFKFSTYAYWWIRQKIKAVIIDYKSRLKASINLYNLAYRIQNYLRMHAKDYFDYEEIAEFLNVSIEKVKKAAPLLSKLVYLDDPINAELGEDNRTVKDTIASHHDFIEDKEMEWLRDFINEFLENNIFPALKDKEIIVLKNRYGLNEERKVLSLKEVGEKIHLSSERVRQLEKGTMNKIRKMEVISVLKELLPYGN